MDAERPFSGLDLIANADTINDVQHLFLRSVVEHRDNTLTIIADEGLANHERKANIPPGVSPEVAPLFQNAIPVEVTRESKTFTVHWDNYVSYLVTNEIHAALQEGDEYEGNLFRVYSKSRFLDFVNASTIPFDPCFHFCLGCENHIIDVASSALPKISVARFHND